MSRPYRQIRRAKSAGPHRQGGVAAVFFGIAIVALMTMVVLGFNVGQLYFAQRGLERQAALAAVAGAQVASGCRAGGVPGGLAAITTAVTNSLAINIDNGAPLPAAAVRIGKIDRTINPGYNTFVELLPGDPAIDTVQVNLSRPQPAVLAAGLFSTPAGTPMMYATASAKQAAVGAFTVGTTLAAVNTTMSPLLNPLLTGLLGAKTAINLSLVDYNGLAQANVSLANLMVAAGVTNLHDLINVSTNLKGALGILSTALSMGTDATSVAAGALISSLAGQTYATGTVSFADLFGTALGTAFNPLVSDTVAALPFISGSDLLTALGEDAAHNANTPFQIVVPVALQIPGVVGEYLYVGVIQAPQFAIGPVGSPTATARTAQLALYLRVKIGDPSNLLGFLVSQVATVALGLDITLANGSGTLSNLSCPNATVANPSAVVDVSTSVAALKLGSFTGSGSTYAPIASTQTPMITVLGLLGIPVLTVDLTKPVVTTAGTALAKSTLPYTNYTSVDGTAPDRGTTYTAVSDANNPQTVGSGTLLSTAIPGLLNSLTQNNNFKITLLGLPLGPALDPIIAGLNTLLLTPLLQVTQLDGLIDSLLKLLGIQVGTVTIDMKGVAIGAPQVNTFCSPTAPCPGLPSN